MTRISKFQKVERFKGFKKIIMDQKIIIEGLKKTPRNK